MPKPFFLARPSGLFVRFLVPADLRHRLGVRFVVRRLYVPNGDLARLAAAQLGAALSEAFAQLRGGIVDDFDFKGILDKGRRGQLRDLTLRDVKFANGTHIGSAEINSPEDAMLFEALRNGHAIAAPSAPPPQATPVPDTGKAPPTPLLLSKAIDAYRQRREAAKLTGDVDVNATLQIFIEMVGDKNVADINDDDTLEFFKATANWPIYARTKKRYRGMTAPEIVKDSQRRQRERDTTLKLLGDNACRKHRDTLAAFLTSLVEAKKLIASPLKDAPRQPTHRIQRRQVRRPFQLAELERIFDPATFLPWTEEKPHYFWAPWIGLYTGARLNEIAQFYLDDIQTFHGIPGFTISPTRQDQRVKTSSSVRFVPIANPLLAAGFLTYVEEVRAAGHHRLFPHLKYGDDYGDYLGDRFIVYLRDIGLKVDSNPDAPGMGFHWFRHTTSNAMVKIASSTLHTAASITGHGSGGIMPGELSKYVQPAELRQKLDTLNKLELPAPPIYTPDTYKDALQEAHKLSAKWERDDAARHRRKAKPAPEA
jgi:integrase